MPNEMIPTELERPAPKRRRRAEPEPDRHPFPWMTPEERKRLSQAMATAIVATLREVRAQHEAAQAAERQRMQVTD